MVKIHQRGQNTDKLFKCEICNKTFFQKRYFKKHNAIAHGIKDQLFEF